MESRKAPFSYTQLDVYKRQGEPYPSRLIVAVHDERDNAIIRNLPFRGILRGIAIGGRQLAKYGNLYRAIGI